MCGLTITLGLMRFVNLAHGGFFMLGAYFGAVAAFSGSVLVFLDPPYRRAEALGATLLLDRTADEDEPLYVLADPSGHPFCIFVG